MNLADGCHYCHSGEELAFLAGPPAEAPDAVVGAIAADPHDHWSGEQWEFLYRRFASRLIDLVRARRVDPGLTLRPFGPSYANLANWPVQERATTENALGDTLVGALKHWPTHELVVLLGGLACAYDDLTPWLARLDTAPAAEGDIIRLTCYWTTSLLWGDDDWFTWWHTDDPVTPVREWTAAVRPRVERFARAHPECKTARDTLTAYDHLDRGGISPWWYPGHGWTQWERRGLPGQFGWLRPSAAN
ncbi:hypothetical protein [Actinophytocola sp. NPDC049390]|uniref:hypothetical protein n=1 Tax=Actinophytocola sp. NPDC049390 TaxID=3363894 RepID=UPI0037B9807C